VLYVCGVIINTMTPKEKAKELYAKVWRATAQPYKIAEMNGLRFETWDKDWTNKLAKACAVISCDEVIYAITQTKDSSENQFVFWNDTKEEVQKL